MSYTQLLTPERHLVAAKRGLGLPVIVVICGSTRFMDAMTEADFQETAAGRIGVRPGCDMKQPHALWGDPADAEDLKYRLDELHRAKIRLADEVLIVGDYIGDSTRLEIDYARALGKPLRYTHPAVDPYGASEQRAVDHMLRFIGTDTTVTVPAVEPVPGLRVYELPEELRQEGDGVTHPWQLGHHDGKAMVAFPTKDDALRAAREVADLADWTLTGAELKNRKAFDPEEYLQRMYSRTNGLVIRAEQRAADQAVQG
ncbi:hypothetical protein GCM10020254_88030 [Streptomyces goshikiensis]